MRVLFIHNRYKDRGGEDEVVDREIELLRAKGLTVELLEKKSSELGSIGSLLAAWRLPYSEPAKLEMEKKIRSFRPDLVHVHNFFPLFTPSIFDACREQSVPVVQTLHNFRIFCASALLARNGSPCELCLGGDTSPARRYSCYRASKVQTVAMTRFIDHNRRANTWNTKIDKFIALSEFSKRKLVEGGIQENKLVVKPNFATSANSPPAFAERENFALYVGRLSEEKGVRTLVESWKNLPFPLKLAGDGPLLAELKAESSGNIVFIGALSKEEVAVQMRKAKFLVVPSECYENFPLVVAEAFSQGLPVLASRIGSLGELIKDGENGFHFSAGDPSALHASALRLGSNPDLLKASGENARRHYLEHYSPEKNFEMLYGIYKDVLKMHRGLS